MGTRSLTYFYNEPTDNQPFLCVYRQFDGYIEGHGLELAQFLNSVTMVNGIPYTEDKTVKFANGMGCLAAQFVAEFKDGAGNIYIHPANVGQDCWQEYEYHVFPDRVVVELGDSVSMNWQNFLEYCKNPPVQD